MYMFIHDALSHYITCGDTNVNVIAHELCFVIGEMKKDEARKVGFENQIKVSNTQCSMHCNMR